jgi:hypothetical protein
VVLFFRGGVAVFHGPAKVVEDEALKVEKLYKSLVGIILKDVCFALDQGGPRVVIIGPKAPARPPC